MKIEKRVVSQCITSDYCRGWNDAVNHIVRCEECVFHTYEEPGRVYCPNIVGGWVSNDFYCADGERKGTSE